MTTAETVTGYCVKCRANGLTMDSPALQIAKNGKPFWKGTCPTCGTGMTRMVGKAEAAA